MANESKAHPATDTNIRTAAKEAFAYLVETDTLITRLLASLQEGTDDGDRLAALAQLAGVIEAARANLANVLEVQS